MIKQIDPPQGKCPHLHNSNINVKHIRDKLSILIEKIKVFDNLNHIKKNQEQKKYHLLDGLRKLFQVIGVVVTEQLTQITHELTKIQSKLAKYKINQHKGKYYQSIKANQEYISKIKDYLLQQHEIARSSKAQIGQTNSKIQTNCSKIGKFSKTKNSGDQQFSQITITPTWRQDSPKFYESFEHQPSSPPTKQQYLGIESKNWMKRDSKAGNQMLKLKTSQSYLKFDHNIINLNINNDAKIEENTKMKQKMQLPISKDLIQSYDKKVLQHAQSFNAQKHQFGRNNLLIPLSRSFDGPIIIQQDGSETKDRNKIRNSIYQNIHNNESFLQKIKNQHSLSQLDFQRVEGVRDMHNPQNHSLSKQKSYQQLKISCRQKKMANSLDQKKKANSMLEQVDKLKQQVAYYCEKYQNYKNIADSQEGLISSLRQQLKECKYHLNNAKTIAKCNLQGNLKVKAVEIARLNEQLAECKRTINELQVKIKHRSRLSQIQICQQDKQTQMYVKQLQKMLDQQQNFLAASNSRIKIQQTQIQRLTIINLSHQKQLNKLYEIISSIEQQNIRAIQEKTQAQMLNKKMKQVIERQQQKLQAMGIKILEIAELNLNSQKKNQVNNEFK